MRKQNVVLRHYQKLIQRPDGSKGEAMVPSSCKRCPNYRPEFKYRSCLYTRCPYKKDKKVFREKHHSRDKFS